MIVKKWAFGWLAIKIKIVRDTSLATTEILKALGGWPPAASRILIG